MPDTPARVLHDRTVNAPVVVSVGAASKASTDLAHSPKLCPGAQVKQNSHTQTAEQAFLNFKKEYMLSHTEFFGSNALLNPYKRKQNNLSETSRSSKRRRIDSVAGADFRPEYSQL